MKPPKPDVPNLDWQEARRGLLAFVRARLADPSAAEDVVQDVLVAALRHTDRLRTGAAARAWLFTVARNRLIDHYRRRARERRALADRAVLDPASPGDGETAAEAARVTAAGCLVTLLDAQAPADRDAVRFIDLEGYAQRDLADLRGLSLPGAKARVQRARRRLREALRRCCRTLHDRRGALFALVRQEVPAGAVCCRPDRSGHRTCGPAARSG